MKNIDSKIYSKKIVKNMYTLLYLMKLYELCIYFSTLSEEDILEAVNAELSTWEEIYLDTIIYSKDCTNLLLKEHVESMVCSDYSDLKVLLIILTVFYINLL